MAEINKDVEDAVIRAAEAQKVWLDKQKQHQGAIDKLQKKMSDLMAEYNKLAKENNALAAELAAARWEMLDRYAEVMPELLKLLKDDA